MKHQNIIALCLGIFVAALLWQYYLWPKYQIKQESPDIINYIEESAQKELEKSINSEEPGEILFVGETVSQENSNSPSKEKDLIFYSQANKPKDLLEQMAQDETKKHNSISVDNNNFIVNPSSMQQEGETPYLDDESRITMIQIPADFLVIKDEKSYENFLKNNEGSYPKVNFKQNQIVVVVSAGKFSDTFFEIVKIDRQDNEVKVFYRVNLMTKNKEKEQRNYKVIENTNLPVNFVQVK